MEQIKFDKELYRFLNMAIEIWPSFKSGIKHLTQIEQQRAQSFLPRKPYSTMTQIQFSQTITDDLFQFIMEHDVKVEDIQDYLQDILDLLMIDEQLSGGYKNPASVQYMANYTIKVIQQLQKGKKDLVTAFQQNIYLNVKQFKVEIIYNKENEDDEQSQEDFQDEEKEQEQQEDQQAQKIEGKSKNKKSEQQMKRQEELQDDGWIIVRK